MEQLSWTNEVIGFKGGRVSAGDGRHCANSSKNNNDRAKRKKDGKLNIQFVSVIKSKTNTFTREAFPAIAGSRIKPRKIKCIFKGFRCIFLLRTLLLLEQSIST